MATIGLLWLLIWCFVASIFQAIQVPGRSLLLKHFVGGQRETAGQEWGTYCTEAHIGYKGVGVRGSWAS